MLFIAGFWNKNNTVTKNTAQNNNKQKDKQKSIPPIRIKKGDCLMQSFNVQLAVHYPLCILSLAAVFLRQCLNDTLGLAEPLRLINSVVLKRG